MNPWAFVACLYDLFFTRYVEPEPPARHWTDGTDF